MRFELCLWVWIFVQLLGCLEAGTVAPLLDPAPWSVSGVLLVVRFTSQVQPPPGATRVKLLLEGFPDTSALEIISSHRLPQVVSTVQTGQSWSFILSNALPSEEMEFLLRVQFATQADRISGPSAQLNIAYALESRPVSFELFEQISIPLDFYVCNTSTLSASSSAPQSPVLASAPNVLQLVRYEFTIDLQEASSGDVLQILPLSAIHSDFGVAAGSECPLLVSQWDELGIFLSWPAASCYFRQFASNRTSNAIEIGLGNPPSTANIVLSVPAPVFGTFGTWLVVLSGTGVCHAAEVNVPNVLAAPSGVFLSVSQTSGVVQVDVRLQKNSDLSEALVVSSNFDILACRVATTSWAPTDVTFSSAVVLGSICRVTILNGWLGPDAQLLLRLSLLPGQGIVTVNAEMETHTIAQQIGWSSLVSANQLASTLFPTGLAIQRPVVFLITFQTGELQAYFATYQSADQPEIAEVVQLRMKLLDASLWRLLRARDGALLQSIPQNLAVDCAEYIRDFSSGSVLPPRRCWGDAMRTNGDAVSIEWWPGKGLQASSAYALEIMAEFLSSTTTADSLLELSIWTTSGGVFVAREVAQLASRTSSLPKSDVTSFMTQQPVINMVSAELKQVNTTNLSVGLFRLALEPGNDEKQWLRAGQSLDIFFLPLAEWDFREKAAGAVTGCNSLQLVVTSGEDDMVAPSCSTFSVGEAGIGFRENGLTLVLGSNTLITPYSQGVLEVSLPLPSTGFFGASILVSCRYQAPAELGAWHATSSFLQWNPRVAFAGFLSYPTGEPGQNLTVELVLASGPTLSSHAGAFFYLQPPADFRILAIEEPPDRAWLAMGNLSDFSGAAVSIPLAADTVVFGGAEYFLRLLVTANAPSSGRREAWQVSIVEGPVEAFTSNLAGVSPGVLITSFFGATIVTSVFQASAITSLAVFFEPLQTQGIFFRYIALTAPHGYDFSAEQANSCNIQILLDLPAQSYCNSSSSGKQAVYKNIATVVLPPFSRLEQNREYGFAVSAVLPSFAEAWVEEANGRGHFQLETQTDESITDTVLLPSVDIFLNGCAEARVAVDGLVPGQVTIATLAFRPGQHHPNISAPLLFLYIHAPSGYNWTVPVNSWSALVTKRGTTSALSDFVSNGLCTNESNVLCVNTSFVMTPEDTITVAAEITIPNENPDDPQGDGLPTPAFWHLKFALEPGQPILPAARWLACEVNFAAPNRVRRIFAAAVEASNAVISADNDISFSITLVTEVPLGGAIVIEAPSSAFAFPEQCVVEKIEATGSSTVVGSPLPESAGAACRSDSQNLAAIVFRLGSVSPSAYLFRVLGVKNIKIISPDDPQYRWRVYSVAAGDSALTVHGTAGVSYLDSPRAFKSFAVTVAMQNAFLETELLDVEAAGFTKQRGKMNQVVLCFQQALASVSGQVLSVSIPEGFQFPWQDSSDCTEVDTNLGVAPMNLSDPFGRGGSPDPARFALFPASQIGCTTSVDKRTAFLTISEALVEIARVYAFRLVVQNAERSPASNLWRLEFGAQASLPFQGLTLQAFQQLSMAASFTGASRSDSAIPNVLEIVFQPSVPVPPGGALQLIPSQGFQLVPSVPRNSRGVLVQAVLGQTMPNIFCDLIGS